jgi:ATP adenylyltransferase
MKHVWAPWRIAYILGAKPGGCFLCIRKTRRYRERHHILADNAHAFVVLNRYPYTSGHLMVAPWRHIAGLDAMTPAELYAFFHLVRFATAALTRALAPDGINLGANLGQAAGAGLEAHVHFHIVARWNGDHNFMPVIGDTMVMPEHLAATYARLLPFFESYAAPERDSQDPAP